VLSGLRQSGKSTLLQKRNHAHGRV
jgi:predicted AAA+ superfamily ATPase